MPSRSGVACAGRPPPVASRRVEAGEAVCWGWNNFGQADVPAGRYTAISAGYARTCAVTEDAAAMCWPADATLPPSMRGGWTDPRGNRYRAISAGYLAACALTEEGEPVCYDRVQLPSGPLVAVTVGWTGHACALRETGEAVCRGEDHRWNLDIPPGPWTAIDAGYYDACGLSEAGEAACWADLSGALPGPPRGRYVSLSTSSYATCLLTDAGEVYCRDPEAWASDGALRLVSEGFRATGISVGLRRICFLTDEGAIVCQGDVEYRERPSVYRGGVPIVSAPER